MAFKTVEQKKLQERLEVLISLSSDIQLAEIICPLFASQLGELSVYLSRAAVIVDELETSVREILNRERD